MIITVFTIIMLITIIMILFRWQIMEVATAIVFASWVLVSIHQRLFSKQMLTMMDIMVIVNCSDDHSHDHGDHSHGDHD